MSAAKLTDPQREALEMIRNTQVSVWDGREIHSRSRYYRGHRDRIFAVEFNLGMIRRLEANGLVATQPIGPHTGVRITDLGREALGDWAAADWDADSLAALLDDLDGRLERLAAARDDLRGREADTLASALARVERGLAALAARGGQR